MKTEKASFDYDRWVDEQTQQVNTMVGLLARRGVFEGKVFVFAACGAHPGFLSVLLEQPEDAVDVVWFPGVGTKVAAVPTTELRQKLWQGCRNMPILPNS